MYFYVVRYFELIIYTSTFPLIYRSTKDIHLKDIGTKTMFNIIALALEKPKVHFSKNFQMFCMVSTGTINIETMCMHS